MSKQIEIESQKELKRIDALKTLQAMYEARGGKGDVSAFLIKGATDPQDGEAEHWGTMSSQEQQLWLDLHATELLFP